MTRPPRWILAATWLGIVVAMVGSLAGCTGHLQSLRSDQQVVCSSPVGLGENRLDHIYVFVHDGFDPVDIIKTRTLRDQVKAAGFCNTYYVRLTETNLMMDLVRQIDHHDHEAHFAFVGYSLGVTRVRSVAKQAKVEGIPIDLIIYLDAYTNNHHPPHDPCDARRIVNFLTKPRGLYFGTDRLPGIENYEDPKIRHVKVPTEPEVWGLVTRELHELAERVQNGTYVPNRVRAGE